MFVGHILNCFISGSEVTPDPSGCSVRNCITLQLGDLEAQLLQIDGARRSDASTHKGKAIHTTDFVVPSALPADLGRCQAAFRSITQLLMFATASEVRAFGYELPGANPCAVTEAVVGVTAVSVPVLDLVDGANTRRYLETTYATYTTLEQSRELPVDIEYSVLAQKSGLPIEVKGAVTFILLEHLKHTYARTAGYPFLGGFYRERTATSAKPGRKLSFKFLLTEMLAAAGMTSNLDTAIALRNELIHSGTTALQTDELLRLNSVSLDLTREYLLRLLGYSGRYIPFSSPNAFLTI